MAKPLIEPRILKGFRDYLPQVTIPRTEMIRKLEVVFSSFGFVPIDTPALEYAEVLLGKGSAETDKQLYRFLDGGERDIALRFDLTVPLARFIAMHFHELGTPFKRYHIAPVWRAEKPQRGRYREFIQCDFDIIGPTSMLADAEIVAVIHEALNALGIDHQIRINNRKILSGLLEELGAKEKTVAVLRIIDKLDKLGAEVVAKELAEEAALNSAQIERVFSFLSLSTEKQSNQELLRQLKEMFRANELSLLGISQLETLLEMMPSLNITDNDLALDLSIARGLDYYTGTVFETTLLKLPHIGSICSGGRYDDLASLYTKQHLPGVGASIGLDRIIGALEELGSLPTKASTAAILICIPDERATSSSLQVSKQLRDAGIFVEVYPEVAKLSTQLKYANKKGFEWAIITGERELENNSCSVKNLKDGEQSNVSTKEVVKFFRDKLSLP